MAYHLRIKVCGVTNPEDACQAALLGADAVGLNFYPPSPRRVDVATAAAIVRELPPFVEPVALFVDQPLPQVLQTLQTLSRIRAVQGYGSSRDFDGPLPFQLIAAFSVRNRDTLQEISHYLALSRERGHLPAALLVDAFVPGLHGGTGHTAPWELLADYRPGLPLILAGGLTPENVAEAVRIVRPYAVDVASGVESSPGRKDAEEMRRFIDTARAAAAGL
jgi:phosphoribosylanthranilate isomerase